MCAVWLINDYNSTAPHETVMTVYVNCLSVVIVFVRAITVSLLCSSTPGALVHERTEKSTRIIV